MVNTFKPRTQKIIVIVFWISFLHAKFFKIKFLTWIQSPFLQVNSSARQVRVQTISSEPSSQSALVDILIICWVIIDVKRTSCQCALVDMILQRDPQSTINEVGSQVAGNWCTQINSLCPANSSRLRLSWFYYTNTKTQVSKYNKCPLSS